MGLPHLPNSKDFALQRVPVILFGNRLPDILHLVDHHRTYFALRPIIVARIFHWRVITQQRGKCGLIFAGGLARVCVAITILLKELIDWNFLASLTEFCGFDLLPVRYLPA